MNTHKRILALAVALLLTGSVLPALAEDTASPAAAVSCEAGIVNDFVKGEATLSAPAGYGIALTRDSADWPASVKTAVTEGEQTLPYYLKGTEGAAIGPQYVRINADLTAPGVSLASPASGVSAAGWKRILLQFTEPIVPADKAAISIFDGTDTYTAPIPALAQTGSGGPWYAALPLSAFVSGSGDSAKAFAPAAGTAYTVTLPLGAYTDRAGRGTPAVSASVETAAADAADCLVTLVLPGTGWSVKTVADPPADVVSGAKVAKGTKITFTAPVTDGEYRYSAFVAGEAYTGAFDQTDFAVTADTEIIASLNLPTLPGSAAITGKAAVGETLSGSLNTKTRAAIPGLTYTWTRGDAQIVAAGDSATTYTVQPDDAGSKLTLSISGSGYANALTASVDVAKVEDPPVVPPVTPETPETPETPPEPVTPAAPGQPSAAAYTSNSVTLNATQGYEYSLGGSAWQTGNTFTGLTAGAQYSFYQRVAAAGQNPASPASPVFTITLPKTEAAAPNPPTAAAITTDSVTLSAVSGYEYAMDGGSFQTSPTFSGLAMGSTHSFTQRVAATATSNASPASAATSVTVTSALSGTISVSGSLQYGKTLVASLTGGNNTGTLTFYWLRDSTTVGSGTTYEVIDKDVGRTLTVQAVSSVQGGMISRQLGTVGKADYIGETPSAPVRESRTTSSITLVGRSGYEYSRGGSTWQDSNQFTGLSAGKGYTFYQRVKATSLTTASPASKGATIYASAGSSTATNPDDEEDTASTGTGGSAGTSTGSDTTTPLTTYSLTGDSTRVLFSNMERLVLGNKTANVTIKLPSGVIFTFEKGSLSLTAGTLWYDFGVTLGGCMHESAAKTLAGDAYVATIHYSMSGNLPGKASILLPLGAANAGKTLYYYKLDTAANTLSYLQSATADASGNVTVSQTSCSDYVFLSREYGAAPETPVPSETPVATATPEPTVLPAATTGGSSRKMGIGGWIVGLIALAALVLLFTGLRAFLRSRMDDGDEPDDYDGDDYDGGDGPDGEGPDEDDVTDLGFGRRR